MTEYRIHPGETLNSLVAAILTGAITPLIAKGMSRDEAIGEVTEIWILLISKLQKATSNTSLKIVSDK
jgi:hypothetical protein